MGRCAARQVGLHNGVKQYTCYDRVHSKIKEKHKGDQRNGSRKKNWYSSIISWEWNSLILGCIKVCLCIVDCNVFYQVFA